MIRKIKLKLNNINNTFHKFLLWTPGASGPLGGGGGGRPKGTTNPQKTAHTPIRARAKKDKNGGPRSRGVFLHFPHNVGSRSVNLQDKGHFFLIQINKEQ